MKQLDAQTLYEAMEGIGEDLLLRSEQETVSAREEKSESLRKEEAPPDRLAVQQDAFLRRRRSAGQRRIAAIGGLVALAAAALFAVSVLRLRNGTGGSATTMEVAYESAPREEAARADGAAQEEVLESAAEVNEEALAAAEEEAPAVTEKEASAQIAQTLGQALLKGLSALFD